MFIRNRPHRVAPLNRTASSVLASILLAVPCGCRPRPVDQQEKTIVISGRVTAADGSALPSVLIVASNNGGHAITDSDGHYEFRLPARWEGNLRPQHANLAFSPERRACTRSSGSTTNQDFVARREDSRSAGSQSVQASAGRPKTVSFLDHVALDGSGSGGPTDRPLVYHWRQKSGPAVQLRDPDRAEASFIAPDVDEPTLLEFELTVSAGDLQDQDTVRIRVDPADASTQALIDAIHQAAHAYWSQRVVMEHPRDGRLFGYCGAVAVLDPKEPGERLYSSDWGFLPQPHIFQESEDSTGHAGMGHAFLKAYGATRDKFLLRCAKQLGDTLLSAQRDNGSGGWWYDMGIRGFDRRENSSTFRQEVDFGRFVNLFAYGGQGNYHEHVQNLGTFDGVSWLPGLFLLRLAQALPPDDPDRERYLAGAKWLADTIVGLAEVVDPDGGFKPYGIGGVPQNFPYHLVKSRPAINAKPGHPSEIPHNAMITLNDHAMTNALFFLFEFWRESRDNPDLDERVYHDALVLNADYLIHVFRLSANPTTGRGGWASQYWINDGSERAGRPTWGRTMEPPGLGFYCERGYDFLIKWYEIETDEARRRNIEDVIARFLAYFRYDAPPVNSRPEWCEAMQLDHGRYDPNNIHTWLWWLWYNHDPSVAPLNVFVASNRTDYVAHYGDEALKPGQYPEHGYPMIRNNGMSVRIDLCLVKRSDGTFGARLFQGSDDRHKAELYRRFSLDTDSRFFLQWTPTPSQVESALSALNPETGFFKTGTREFNGRTYQIIGDEPFITNVQFLAWGLEQSRGKVRDRDGDGYSDLVEQQAGTDPLDSESYPQTTASEGAPASGQR